MTDPHPPVAALPALLRHGDQPVFRAPWEAEAFAIAVALHARGAFTWPQWASALADTIAAARAAGNPDQGEDYYRHWLATLERLLDRTGLAAPAELRERAALIAAAQAADHGSDHDHDHDHDHDLPHPA